MTMICSILGTKRVMGGLRLLKKKQQYGKPRIDLVKIHWNKQLRKSVNLSIDRLVAPYFSFCIFVTSMPVGDLEFLFPHTKLFGLAHCLKSLQCALPILCFFLYLLFEPSPFTLR